VWGGPPVSEPSQSLKCLKYSMLKPFLKPGKADYLKMGAWELAFKKKKKKKKTLPSILKSQPGELKYLSTLIKM
jgi:hypothetical protein